MRGFGEFFAKRLDEPGLADAGLADDLNELALAAARARPAVLKQGKFVLASDQRR
jgi:hypothetical protein